jgi:competence protein ComEC
MQYKLSHLPFVRIILPFVTGILLFDRISTPYLLLLIASCSCLFVLLCVHIYTKTLLAKRVGSLLIYLQLFLAGGLLNSGNHLNNQPLHFRQHQAAFAKGIVTKPLEEKEKSYKTFISVHQLIDSNLHTLKTSGNLLIYLEKDSLIPALEIGDEILFPLHFKETDSIKNPAQFDYRKFLSYKSVYHQQYLKAHEIEITSRNSSAVLWIKRISHRISTALQSILRTYIPDKEKFALADGILLGHRAELDEELYNAFAYTGIMHILSVSGLHVGIIYGMLLFFLSFIKDSSKKIKIAKFIFVFLFIWMFAFVTGFSAACVRAAILFSLLNFGSLMKEHYSSLNLLAGAAFLQLLINPNSLFEIGFQLSYLAMLGLIIFTRPIYSLYYHPNKAIDWTWKLWSASIAAQLFTVPLSIYYFGNFPTYFLIANIFAIPLSAVILWLDVFLILFSFIPFVPDLLGWLNSQVIGLFIAFTLYISDLPFGKVANLYLLKEQLILLLFAVLLLSFFAMNRKKVFLFTSLSILLLTILISYLYSIKQIRQTNIIVYAVRNNLILGVKYKDRQYLISADSISEKDYSFNIKNSQRLHRISSFENILLQDSIHLPVVYYSNNLLYANGTSFYFLNQTNTRKQFEEKLRADYLVLSDNCYLDIQGIQANYDYKHLLISGNNDYKHLNIYRKLLQKQAIPFHDLTAKALVIQ